MITLLIYARILSKHFRGVVDKVPDPKFCSICFQMFKY